jgi:amidase
VSCVHGHRVSSLQTGSPLRVDGHDEDYWMVSGHSTLFNYSGHPAVVLPYRLDRDGVPTDFSATY